MSAAVTVQHDCGIGCMLDRVPAPRAVLLVGMPGSGKTLVAQAIAHSTGAAFFDLSPRTTDGKWLGKAAATMVRVVSWPAVSYIPDGRCSCIRCIRCIRWPLQLYMHGPKWPSTARALQTSRQCCLGAQKVRMVVRCAKLLAPSVIYIDEAEKVQLRNLLAAIGCYQRGRLFCSEIVSPTIAACLRHLVSVVTLNIWAERWTCCHQVFVTDKRKIKQYDRQEPPGRIRRALLAEVRLPKTACIAILQLQA